MDTLSDKKKRRSKKDSDGRSYTCECGKSYLSYQALYTHKRTKHTDSQQQIDETPKKKRGRPKGLKLDRSEFDPCFPLGDSPLVKKIQQWRATENHRTCDDAFAEFLMEKSTKSLRKEYKSIAASILSLRECINKHYKELNDTSILEDGQDYTKNKNAVLLPKISNVYVLNYLPENRPDHNKETEVNFMLNFCAWLMEKNYTDLEVAVLS